MKYLSINRLTYIALTVGVFLSTSAAIDKAKIPEQAFIFTNSAISGMGATLIFFIWSIMSTRYVVIKSSLIKNIFLQYTIIIAIAVLLTYFYLMFLGLEMRLAST